MTLDEKMEDENRNYAYTYRSINVAAASCLLAVFLVAYGFGSAWQIQLTLDFALIGVAFMLCSCFAYFAAAGIAFYFRETFQTYAPVWLVISFFGSIICTLSASIVGYIVTLIEIRNYKEPVKSDSMFSAYELGSSFYSSLHWSRPELPTLDKFISSLLICTLILFVATSLVSSVVSLIASKIPEKRTEEAYTFLEL